MRTAWVYFHPMVDVLREQGLGAHVPREFYASDLWTAKANSTDRLTVTNYQALHRMAGNHDLELVRSDEALKELPDLLDDFDNVVVNLVASPRAISFLKELSASPAYEDRRARLIFGTEMTPFSEVAKGNLTQREIAMLYFENTILRHTGRTDAPIYSGGQSPRAHIVEFPLGVDTDLLHPDDSCDKKFITMVKAPRGRLTKNNEGVDEIAALIKAYRNYPGLEVKIVEPPYTSRELWDIFRESAYLIFTSRGETFSYVANDAMAHGVVSFIRSEMFTTRTPAFSADSYLGHGTRYRSNRELLRALDSFVLSPEQWLAESLAARESVVRRFSVDSVARAWSSILSREPLPRRSLLVLDGAAPRGREEVARLTLDHGASLVMFDKNRDWAAIPNGGHAESLAGGKVDLVRHYLSEIDGALWRYDRLARWGESVPVERLEETVDHLSLVCRLHGVTDLRLDERLVGSTMEDAVRAWLGSSDPESLFKRSAVVVDLRGGERPLELASS